jgi:hypothetical protein
MLAKKPSSRRQPGEDRMQPALLPHSLEDYVDEENPVRVIEVFINELDLAALEPIREVAIQVE